MEKRGMDFEELEHLTKKISNAAKLDMNSDAHSKIAKSIQPIINFGMNNMGLIAKIIIVFVFLGLYGLTRLFIDYTQVMCIVTLSILLISGIVNQIKKRKKKK